MARSGGLRAPRSTISGEGSSPTVRSFRLVR
jgi:hypothetical protein